MNIQVIFQVRTARTAQWLDYCREPSPHTDDKSLNMTNRWATEHCNRLEKQTNDPFRFKIEIWN